MIKNKTCCEFCKQNKKCTFEKQKVFNFDLVDYVTVPVCKKCLKENKTLIENNQVVNISTK